MKSAPATLQLTFLGGGNLATALISGLIARGTPADSIRVIDPASTQRETLSTQFGVTTYAAPEPTALESDVVILAVKPQHMHDATRNIAPWIRTQLVISVAAGIRAEAINNWLGGYRRIVRAMPNTPAHLGLAATGIAGLSDVQETDLELTESVLSAIGVTARVDNEALLDAVTALSGSGPAYVFRFIEALIAGGTALGLAPETARTLAIQTVLGAAQLAAQSSEEPSQLRERVTSKGGTTAAALTVLDQHGWSTLLLDAMVAAAERSRELGALFGTQATP